MRSTVHYIPILTTLFAAFFAPQRRKSWGAKYAAKSVVRIGM